MIQSCAKVKDSLECLAVVDDRYHILDIELRKLSVPQVLLFVNHHLFSVSKHTHTRYETFVPDTKHHQVER